MRYYIIARLALEKKISFIASPNPTTLLKIAETGQNYQEEIIRSIHNGVLMSQDNNLHTIIEPEILKDLNHLLRPDKKRADFLSTIVHSKGSLLPQYYWPDLQLIGCWLGGSVGFLAKKMSTVYGKTVPIRDLGFLASEGCMTIPLSDNTPAGILALENNYYEFIPEEESNSTNPHILLSHELNKNKKYKILLTNNSGLYRYDINDIVEVTGFYHQTPLISFLRKGDDMLNITGEKLHVNHFLETFKILKEEYDFEVNQFRVVSNSEKLQYEILLDLKSSVTRDFLQTTILPAMDKLLAKINMEYEVKRKSKRLRTLCLHIMDAQWKENIYQKHIKAGHRDVQFKWQTMAQTFHEPDKKHIKDTVRMEKF